MLVSRLFAWIRRKRRLHKSLALLLLLLLLCVIHSRALPSTFDSAGVVASAFVRLMMVCAYAFYAGGVLSLAAFALNTITPKRGRANLLNCAAASMAACHFCPDPYIMAPYLPPCVSRAPAATSPLCNGDSAAPLVPTARLTDTATLNGLHDSSTRQIFHHVTFLNPDCQANVSTCTSENQLVSIDSRRKLYLRGVEGGQGGVITAIGTMRCSMATATGAIVTFDVPNTHVCPSSGCNLIGNDARNHGVVFNSESGHLKVTSHDKVHCFAATLTDGLFQVASVVHQVGATHAAGTSALAVQYNQSLSAPPATPASRSPPVPLTCAEYFGGIGCASRCIGDNFQTVAYFDSNDEAAEVFSDSFQNTPMHSSIADCMRFSDRSDSFVAAASRADVGISGSPCGNLSHLNVHRDESGSDARLLCDSLDLREKCDHKCFIVETLPSALRADDGRLYGNFMVPRLLLVFVLHL